MTTTRFIVISLLWLVAVLSWKTIVIVRRAKRTAEDFAEKERARISSYCFCESVSATSLSPWCIRKITKAGTRPGGNIDTDSLCGRVRSPMGWDVNCFFDVEIDIVCRKCKEILESQT